MTKAYLHNLTALRGMAAILVAVLHFHFFLGPVVPYNDAGIIDKFYLMVDLFFILSGFIMCYVYESSFSQKIERKNYKTFIIARFARIYPLHSITLGAEILIFLFILLIGKFGILPAHFQHLYRLDAIPVQLTFLQTVGIFNFDTFNAPAWSLSAEWWAYILFPFLFFFFRKVGYKNWVMGLLIVVFGWLSIEFILSGMEPFMEYPPDPNKQTLDVNWHYGTFRGIIGFIAGMVVWQLYTRQKIKSMLGNGWALLFLIILSTVSMYVKFYDTITVLLFACIILSSAYGSKNTDAFYSWKIWRKLGQWSFSIYMWHMIIIHLILVCFISRRIEPIQGLLRPFRNGYPVALLLVLFLILTCFIGWLSFKYIETPTRKWINKKYS